MTKFLLIVAALSFGGFAEAQAASINCDGSFLFYKFNVKAKTDGTRVGGRASILVTRNGSVMQNATLPVVRSNFSNQALSFVAQENGNRVEVNANFVSAGRYEGTMDLRGSDGGTNVSTVCSVR